MEINPQKPPTVAERHSVPHPRLRSFLGRCRELTRSAMVRYGVGSAILALSIYHFTDNLAVNIIAGFLGIIGLAATARGTYKTMRTYYTWPLSQLHADQLEIADSLKISGYAFLQRDGVPGDALLTSSRVNRSLFNGSDSELIEDKSPFRAGQPEQVSAALEVAIRKRGGILFNDAKVRIATEPMLNASDTLAPTRIQRTSYLDTLRTNDALNLSVRFGVRGGRIFLGSQVFNGQDFCFPAGIIPECVDSACSNQVGTSTLALTTDNNFAIVGQSRSNAFSKMLWAPSGSGSADWPRDVSGAVDARSLQQFIRMAAQRELLEECGLEHLGRGVISWLRVIGYGRLLNRGGLPQFFCIARVGCTLSEFRLSRPERAFIQGRRQMYFDTSQPPRQAIATIRNELREQSENFSSVLWYLFELLWQMSDGDLEEAFAGL